MAFFTKRDLENLKKDLIIGVYSLGQGIFSRFKYDTGEIEKWVSGSLIGKYVTTLTGNAVESVNGDYGPNVVIEPQAVLYSRKSNAQHYDTTVIASLTTVLPSVGKYKIFVNTNPSRTGGNPGYMELDVKKGSTVIYTLTWYMNPDGSTTSSSVQNYTDIIDVTSGDEILTLQPARLDDCVLNNTIFMVEKLNNHEEQSWE